MFVTLSSIPAFTIPFSLYAQQLTLKLSSSAFLAFSSFFTWPPQLTFVHAFFFPAFFEFFLSFSSQNQFIFSIISAQTLLSYLAITHTIALAWMTLTFGQTMFEVHSNDDWDFMKFWEEIEYKTLKLSIAQHMFVGLRVKLVLQENLSPEYLNLFY